MYNTTHALASNPAKAAPAVAAGPNETAACAVTSNAARAVTSHTSIHPTQLPLFLPPYFHPSFFSPLSSPLLFPPVLPFTIITLLLNLPKTPLAPPTPPAPPIPPAPPAPPARALRPAPFVIVTLRHRGHLGDAF
ncbi:unnamed protein product [Closterium sp. NIES-54]